jgi:hypothetical protein
MRPTSSYRYLRFTVLFIVSVLAAGGALAQQCVVGLSNAPTIAQLSDLQNAPGQPNDTVGVDFHEYAVILQDIAVKDHHCDTAELRNAFTLRLRAQQLRGGFGGFLHGGSTSFAYLTGLILGSRHELTPELDALLMNMNFVPSDCPGHTSGRWTAGDDCMDDFTVDSEGYAWRAAYVKLSDRVSNDRQQAISFVRSSLLDTDHSICIYDQKGIKPEDVDGSGPCNDTFAHLAEHLGDDNGTALIPLNHGMEDANYGIGLVATLANTYLALSVAGEPVNDSDFEGRANDVLTSYKALWLQGQHAAGPEPDAEPVPGTPDPFLTANLKAWNPAGCYRPSPDGTPLEVDDFAHRDRPCWDQGNLEYRITTYPVAAFYEHYVDGYKGDPNKFQYSVNDFRSDKFFNGDGSFKEPLGFFGVGRYLIYFTLTHDWLVHPENRPELGGFTPPTCANVAVPRATVSGGGTFSVGNSVTINVAFTAGGPWNITWSDGREDKDIVTAAFTRTATPSAATTYTITSITGGGCAGIATGSAAFVPTNTRIFVDSVSAGAGVVARYGATLINDNGAIANADLTFSVLGDVIGTARTDAAGRAQLFHAVDVEPGSYAGAIKVTYAGDANNAPTSATATLTIFCDLNSFTVRPDALNVLAAGGSFPIVVATSDNCPWTPGPNVPWIHIVPNSEQRGTGTFNLVVDPTTSGTRTGSVLVGSRRISVQQTAVCTYRFNPDGAYLQSETVGSTQISVSAPDGCPWTVTTDSPSWLHLDQFSGSGNGTIVFHADVNNAAARVAHLTIADGATPVTTFVNQYAPPPCTEPHLEIDARGGSVSNGSNVVITPVFSGTRLLYDIWVDGNPKVRTGLGQIIQARWDAFYPTKTQPHTFYIIARNECGGADVGPVTWTDDTPAGSTCLVPVFNAHPNSVDSPRPGATVSIGVWAVGPNGEFDDGSLKYQWYKGVSGDRSQKVPNGTHDSIFVSPGETSRYWVEVSNDCGPNISGTGTVFVTGTPRRRAVSHDFTGDGKADLVWHNEATAQNELWWMFGAQHTNTTALTTNPDPQAQIQSVGDLNGDEQPDLIWRNPATGQNSVWMMSGMQIARTGQLEARSDPRWSIGGVADIDDDGQDDVVWHNDATGANEIWFQNETAHTGTFALPSTPDGNWGLHGAADFTRDGKPDLFFHNRETGENSIWVMDDARPSSMTSNGLTETSSASHWSARAPRATMKAMEAQADTNLVPAQIVDLNGDDQPDIVWRNTTTGENSVWLMSGTSHVATQAVDPQPDPNWSIGGGGSTNGSGGGAPPDTRATPTLSVTGDPAAYNSAAVITATLTSNGAPLPDRTIVFALNSNEVARLVTDANGAATAGASVAGIAAGTYPNAIAVRFEGDTQYAPASATADLVVSAPQAAVTWTTPAAIANGTPLGSAQLNATANVPGSFVYTPAAGTILGGGYHVLTVVFTPGDVSQGSVTKSVVLLVNKGTFAITWPSPAPIAYGTPLGNAQLNATASVAGTFTYMPAAGSILAVGTQTLQATFTPADSDNYDGANASTTINVVQGTQSLTWIPPQPIVYGTPLSVLQLNANAFTSGSAPAGALTYSPSAGTVLAAGPHRLAVTAAATPFYAAASTTTDLLVLPATPSITWPLPAPISYGTPLGATQLNATASVAGTFTYAPLAGTILNAGANQTLIATFHSSDPNYTNASKSVTITVVKANPVIAWTKPVSIVYGTPLSLAQLNATASVPGTFVYSPAIGTILNAGNTQTLSVHFTPSDANNYESASAATTIDVAKAPQTIAWSSPSPIVYGTLLGPAQLNATVSVIGPSPAGALTYAPPAGTLLQAGAAQTLTVSAAATPNYDAASASVSIDVLQAKPILTWRQPSPIIYGTLLGTAQLDATANVAGAFTYTPPAGTLLEAGPQPLAAHFTPADTRNYEDADANVTLEVQRATPVLTWSNPAPIVYGVALSSAQLNATANVPGTFTYTPAAGTILDAGATQTLHAHFAPNDTRNYNENDASVTIDVAKAKQTLSWNAPVPIVYGTALSSAQLNAQVSVVGPAPAGSLVYAPAGGALLDAGGHTLTVNALETNDYEPATLSVPLDVTRAPLTLRLDAKAKLYGDVLPQLTGTLSGVMNNDPITPVYATSATQQSPTGTYAITATLVDPSHRLFNYDVTIVPSILTVAPAPLLISANPATKQYSDPLPQLTATFTGLVLGETPAVLSGTLVIATTATTLSAPGAYPITIGGLTSSNYAITYAGATFTVTPEDARVTITSPFDITAPPASPASITLTATIKDISATSDANGDTFAGDIRNATLTFVDRATNNVLCVAPIGLASADDARTAVATCTFTRTFATGTTSLLVGARVGAYYTRDAAADDATLTIAPPPTASLTGGGTTAAGSFNINLKYDKNGEVKPQFTFRYESGGHTFEITAAEVDSLAIRTTANGGVASVVGSAMLRDLTTSAIIDADAPLVVVATDDGEPSTRDSLAVTLLKKSGGFWLATAWDGARANAQNVINGNIAIH